MCCHIECVRAICEIRDKNLDKNTTHKFSSILLNEQQRHTHTHDQEKKVMCSCVGLLFHLEEIYM